MAEKKPKSVSKPVKKNQSEQDDLSNIVDKEDQAALGSLMDITGHKQAESPRDDAIEALRQSEEKYRNIFENIAEGYFEVDLAGTLTFFNDSTCVLLGYSQEEMIGLNYRQFTDKENAKILVQEYIKVYKTGQPAKEVGYQIIRKDGTKRYVEASVLLIKDSSGNPIGFRSISHDITERKQMEDEMSQSEERYRTILDEMENSYFEVDLSGNYTFVNYTNCRQLGYSKEEILGLNFRIGMDKESIEIVSDAFKNIYITGKPQRSIFYKAVCKDGTTFFADISGFPMKNKKGEIIGFRGLGLDITERKHMESQREAALETLRQSEEKYRTIIETIADGYFEIDSAGNFIFVNDALCGIHGYPRNELLGMNYQQYSDKENARKVFEGFNKIYKTGKSGSVVDYEIIRKDGTKRQVEVSASIIKYPAGKPIGFRGITRDITERKQMESQREAAVEALRQSEEKHRNIIENMQEPYYEADLEGNFTFVNDALCKHLGYSREELIGKKITRKDADKEIAKRVYEAYNRIYKTGLPDKGIEDTYTKKDGTEGFAELSVSLIRNAEGKPIGFRGTSHDITERKQAESQREAMLETIRQSEERYRTIIEQMEEGYFETDISGKFTFINDAECRNLGYSREEMIGMNRHQYADEKNAKTLVRLFTEVYKTGMPVKAFDLELTKKDGMKAFNQISVSLIQNAQGEAIGFRGIARDITEHKINEERIEYLATHDSLTGLPNRLMFSQLLNHAVQSARRNKRQLAVLFIDLDRFKIINDTMGHDAGDQLLQETARRFKQSLRAVDVVGRLGGDEFVILIEEVKESSQVAIVANKILTSATKPIVLLGEECRVTASIGISIYPQDGEDEQSLMKNADSAMYFAKEEGKNNYQFYSKDLQSLSNKRLSIEANMRSALEHKEFSLQYQAKLDFKTGMITGVEALLRWQSPSLGSVTPTQFIPVAEETGLIVLIGRWVLKTACAQNVAWQRQGLPPVCMAVNLSLRQLTDNNLLEDIEAALKDSGMAPNLLELEITESMIMYNPERLITVLTNIKKMGVRLALDNFGTGYSSLARVKHFPIDILKVDRSIIHNLQQDSDKRDITEAIITMGKTLSLTVVAEGVETQEQEDFLREHICDEMQGFYFSKPIEPDQFGELLHKHDPSSQK